MGDGKTSPFGDGKGGGAGGSGGTFDPKTGTGPRSPGASPPYQQRQLPQQKHNPLEELGGAAGVPSGGKDLRADPKPGSAANQDIGIGLPGNPARPFRLNGGGK